jgi:thioesterase domain-containing protein
LEERDEESIDGEEEEEREKAGDPPAETIPTVGDSSSEDAEEEISATKEPKSDRGTNVVRYFTRIFY